MPAITLTRAMIESSRVIARGRGIRDVACLVRTYGGSPARWIKKSTRPLPCDGVVVEYHWYEHHGIGRREIKVVWKGPRKP